MIGALLMALMLTESQTKPANNFIESALDAAFPFDGARYEGGNVHDPSILLFGDTYVMVNTSGNELAPISTSKDLITWKSHGPILPDQPEWLKKAVPDHRSVWAPAPVKVGRSLRIYYCASEKFGSNTSYIAYAECEKFDPSAPEKGWVDKGLLIKSKAGESNFNAIDPDVLIAPDGRHWMVYGSYWSGMYLVELDPATGALKDPAAAPLHVASNTADRGNPLEAPTLLFRKGYYYLVVTYGLAAQGIRSTYRMVCGRSKSPTGPFLGFDGKPMTEGGNTVLLRSSAPMFGPGGGNFFVNGKGDFLMAYHYYDGRRFWNRDLWGAPTLQIRELVWGADGWPLPGLPVGIELKAGSSSPVGEWKLQVDFGHVQEVTFEKNGTMTMRGQSGTWRHDGDQLVLTWPNRAAGEPAFVDTLILDSTNQYAVGRNQAGVVIRAVKQNVQTAR